MKIEIETDGYADGTRIRVNGKDLTDPSPGRPRLKFFEFSVNAERTGKAKLVMQMLVNGQGQYIDMYAESFKKYDETEKLKEDGNVIGRRKNA